MRKSGREHRLFNLRRILIEVAIANPVRSNDEVGNSGPAHARWTIRPRDKVRLLVAAKIVPLGLHGEPFELNRLLSLPTDDEGAVGLINKIAVLSRRLPRIEDDLKLRSRRNANQGRLRSSGLRYARYDSVAKTRHERVKPRFVHVDLLKFPQSS